MQDDAKNTAAGPLLLPGVPHKIALRLRGHATSSRWLPEGLSRGLDALRSEQLRYRDQVACEMAGRHELIVKFEAEDTGFEIAQREAFRAGAKAAPDRRTSAENRAAPNDGARRRLPAVQGLPAGRRVQR